MEKKVTVVCIVVGILGLTSALSGFAAEANRTKASEIRAYQWECVYPSSPSMGLGIGAALALAVARIILSFAGGWCTCCRTNKNSKSTNTDDSGNPVITITRSARLCSILSWLASVVGMFLLLLGAAAANKQGGEVMGDGTIMCYTVKAGVFAGGGIMAITSVFFGTIFYLILISSNSNKSLGGGLPPGSCDVNHDIEKPGPPPPIASLQLQPQTSK